MATQKTKPYRHFGTMLISGIKQLATTSQTPLTALQIDLAHELAVGLTTLYTWRRGEHLPEAQLIKKLATIFVQRWQADEVWITEFLEAGNYGPPSAATQLLQGLFSNHQPFDHSTSSIDQAPDTLPDAATTLSMVEENNQPVEVPVSLLGLPGAEVYYPLSGREAYIQAALSAFQDKADQRIIVIDGLGGQGKTALTGEIVRRGMQVGLFSQVLIESAKQESFVGSKVESLDNATLTLDDLLDSMARQLALWHIPTLSAEEKQRAIRQVLTDTSYLIVIDNLETFENARALVVNLRHLLGKSRLIITSRHQLDVDFVYSLTLSGLSLADSLTFLRQEAKQRNREAILQASDETLWELHQATGGGVLAMKLIVGQASLLPLDVIIDNLRDAKDESFYRFIYLETWKLLSIASQKLMIYMRTVATTCAYQELASVHIADDPQRLQQAIAEAVQLSLLIPTQLAGELRYGIHQLTRHFLNSDLPAFWREKGLL